jgi:hypothetical protein
MVNGSSAHPWNNDALMEKDRLFVFSGSYVLEQISNRFLIREPSLQCAAQG